MNKAWFQTDVLFLECHLDEGDVFSYTVWKGPTLLKDVQRIIQGTNGRFTDPWMVDVYGKCR